MTTHELKIWPQFFEAVADGRKTFEYRKADRDFKFGDTVILKEFVPELSAEYDPHTGVDFKKGFTGRQAKFMIGFVLPVSKEVDSFSAKKVDHVIFSLLSFEGIPS